MKRTSNKPRSEVRDEYLQLKSYKPDIFSMKDQILATFPASANTIAFTDDGFFYKVVAYAHIGFICDGKPHSEVFPYLQGEAGPFLELDTAYTNCNDLIDFGQLIFTDYISREDVLDFYDLYESNNPEIPFEEYEAMIKAHGLVIIE